MSTQIIHGITFYQKRKGEERSAVLQLNEGFEMFAMNQGHGTWFHKRGGESNPFNINLYQNTDEVRKRLFWRWDPDQHGGLITIGLTAKGASHSGDDEFEKVMFRLRGAKRYVNRWFEVASGKKVGSTLEGEGFYEFGGSSDSFDQGSGTWMVMSYT